MKCDRAKIRTRKLFTSGVASVAIVGLVWVSTAAPAVARPRHDHGQHHSGRFDVVQSGFMTARTTLDNASPRSMGLDPAPIKAAWNQIDTFANPADPETKPLYSSAVGVMGHQGKIVSQHHLGYSLQYADGEGTKLPGDQRIKATQDTIYDLASITKLFTSTLIMQLVEQGTIDLDAPYATYLPEFANHDKEAITIRQMLTHTSGLVPDLPLWSDYPDHASRIKAVMDTTPATKPGTAYTYSDLNLISLGVLAEKMTNKPLDVLLQERIAKPLGLRDTGYNPDPAKKHRIAATEFQTKPDRGMVWGEVHDENAWSLGGVAGHAGVFSTAHDMSILAQTMLNGGSYAGARILKPDSVEAMITNENTEFPSDSHGLGFELNQMWYMGGLASPETAGHTGFTGTSLVIDFKSRSFVVLLTNGVHPSRSWGSTNPARRAAANGLAAALAVKPRKGPTEWFGGAANLSEHTLQTALSGGHGATLRFDTFADNEATDVFALETSADQGKSWKLLPFSVTTGKGQDQTTAQTDGTWNNQGNRTWGKVEAVLPKGQQLVRWRYTTDTNTLGRGVFVDDVKVTIGHHTIFNGERQSRLFTADGFTEVQR